MNKSMTVNLGSKSNIPLGQGLCFLINGEEVAVFRSRADVVFAVENRCPHRKGPLSDGVMGAGKVVCPLHGHKFDLMTGQGSEPRECVRAFRTWEENGQVMLEYPSELAVSSKP